MLAPRGAAAQTAALPPALTGNGYSLEIFQGPLLAPIHVTGVGGAYVAWAENTEGSAVNAASPAVRDPYSVSWFDFHLSIGASLPGAFASTDFDNHGDSAGASSARAGDFIDLTLGATLQFGGLGFSATSDLEQFSLTTTGPAVPGTGASGFTMEIGRWKLLGAYALMDGQVILGGGARIVTMQIQDNVSSRLPVQSPIANGTDLLVQNGSTLLTMTGAAPEVGALFVPRGFQWRLGAAARAPVSGGIVGGENLSKNAEGARTVGPFVLPSSVVMPWEVDLGVAYQLGPRPLNPGWENPHDQEASLRRRISEEHLARAERFADELEALPEGERAARAAAQRQEEDDARADETHRLEVDVKHLRDAAKARYENWPREKILFLASVLLTGPSANAVSVAGFLDQRNETVGRVVTATPRLGIEGEPLRDRMILRVGTYVEPSRYEDVEPRQHFTFGGDVRLFPVDFWGLLPKTIWKIGVAIDVAPRYSNYGLAIGNWH